MARTLMKRSVCVILAVLGLSRFGTAAEPPAPRCLAEVQAVLAQVPTDSKPSERGGIHIILVADVKDHGPGEHDYPLWQKRWTPLLQSAPRVKVTNAWKWPSDQQFASADLLAFFCYRSGGERRTWNAERIEQLRRYLSDGGGLVVIHSATYTGRTMGEEADDRISSLTGLVFDRTIRYRHGAVTLNVVAKDHPICLGLPQRIEFVDEPYWPPQGKLASVEVLAASNEAHPDAPDTTSPQPLFWTYRPGKGRVFGCVMGHYSWTFEDAYFRIFLLRGMAWAAGESPYRFDPLALVGLADSLPTDKSSR